MKEPTVNQIYVETSKVAAFSVKFEYSEYRVLVTLEDSFGEPYLDGVTVSHQDAEENKRLFVFDISRMEDLQLAATIHEKVCELLGKRPQPAKGILRSKVSGKPT